MSKQGTQMLFLIANLIILLPLQVSPKLSVIKYINFPITVCFDPFY